MKKTIYQLSALFFGFALLAGMLSSSVFANENPQSYSPWQSGNATNECKTVGTFTSSYKLDVEKAPNGTYDTGSNSITVSNSTGKVFDWSATSALSAVIVVGGNNANVWSYNPAVTSGNGLYSPNNPAGNQADISHVSFCWNEDKPEVPPYLFQFEKVWEGDEIDEDAVEVTFSIGETEWKPGDDPVEVKPGTELTPLSEKVTGLPENCSYTSDLPESYIVFEELIMPARAVNGEVLLPIEPLVDTLEVTNTVTCEEDEDETVPGGGEVLGDQTGTTETVGEVLGAQQVVAPVGGVSAGAGSAQVVATSLAGLAGSLTAVSYGAVRFFKGE